MFTYDIWLTQGDSLDLSLNVKDDNQLPLNLSGYSVSGFIKYQYSDPNISGTPITCNLDNPISGLLSLSLTPNQTNNLSCYQYVYDVNAFNSLSLDSFKILKGYVNVLPEVTNLI